MAAPSRRPVVDQPGGRRERDEHVHAQVARLRDLESGRRAWPAVVALGHSALPGLEEVLRGRSEVVSQPRRLAAAAIGAIGGAAAQQALRRALRDCLERPLDPILRLAEDEVVAEIADALVVHAGPDDAEALLAALQRRANAGCARALGSLRTAAAVPVLVQCLSDATAADAAAEALRSIGSPAVPSLTAAALLPVLQGEYEGATSARKRARAVKLLGEIGGPATDLPLAVALCDTDRDVRFSAALALAVRHGGGPAAIPVLLEALADERWLVALEAEAALSALAGELLLRGVRARER